MTSNRTNAEMGSAPKISAWLEAFRLRTLPLALASIAMGSFLAAFNSRFDWAVFVLCIATTALLQILSNLANDYGDTVNGADGQHREGPARAVQSGAISKSAMMRAIILFVVLSFASGLWLLYLSLGFNAQSFVFFLVLGIAAILAAIGYTMGRRPYGYMGLGDISVMLFFGLVGVLGTFYLYTGTMATGYVLPALSCGFFSTAVLNVNNIRDINADKLAGKQSIPVRLGRQKAVVYHWFLLVSGVVAAVSYTLINYYAYTQWLFLLAFPLLIINGRAVTQHTEASKLDPYLKQMAMATLLFVLTFGLGILLAK